MSLSPPAEHQHGAVASIPRRKAKYREDYKRLRPLVDRSSWTTHTPCSAHAHALQVDGGDVAPPFQLRREEKSLARDRLSSRCLALELHCRGACSPALLAGRRRSRPARPRGAKQLRRAWQKRAGRGWRGRRLFGCSLILCTVRVISCQQIHRTAKTEKNYGCHSPRTVLTTHVRTHVRTYAPTYRSSDPPSPPPRRAAVHHEPPSRAAAPPRRRFDRFYFYRIDRHPVRKCYGTLFQARFAPASASSPARAGAGPAPRRTGAVVAPPRSSMQLLPEAT